MLLQLSERHKEDVAFLLQLTPEILGEFCHIAVDFLQHGANRKVFSSAAKKLRVEPGVVERAVNGLAFLLSEGARLNLSDMDFSDSLLTLTFSEESKKTLTSFHMEHRATTRAILAERQPDLPHYTDLEWKLEVQVLIVVGLRVVEVLTRWAAGKSMSSTTSPASICPQVRDRRYRYVRSSWILLTIRITPAPQSFLLQADVANLRHLGTELEDALKELRKAHARRIMRNIK
eukprot:TRINITY_DN909_c0_g1_i3.p1 TRINITY_DN909_c0_g1~~TRINITY_DN909_c0_g1_i3.p1  ORF type:complete len:232 (+),score=33.21 TRINITY_DN909_c0_g1_i3:76-771(+)